MIVPYEKETVERLRSGGYRTVWVDAEKYGEGTICMEKPRKDIPTDKYGEAYLNWRWGGVQGEILRLVAKKSCE